MYRTLGILMVGGMLFAVAMPSASQEGILSQLYGNGVHAYFAGQYEEAYELFSSAAKAGTKDPRVYYFRGLSYLQLGREEEARIDFAKGAELEMADVNQLYPVGRALHRVQGKYRLLLEEYRKEARLASWNRQRAAEKARYEGLRQRTEEILKEQAQGAKPVPTTPPIEAPLTPPQKPAPLPFMEEPVEKLPSATKPEEEPKMLPEEKPAEAPGPSPFEMPGEKPAAKPTLPSPFEEMPAEKPAEEPAMEPEEPSKPAPSQEKPEAPSEQEKPSGQAKRGGLLQGLWGAVRKTAEEITKPVGQTLEKALPSGGAGVSPFPGQPKFEAPVPPPPFPNLPGGMPGMEKAPQVQPGANPFEPEPAAKPAEKPSESPPEKPVEKLPLPKLPNPFE